MQNKVRVVSEVGDGSGLGLMDPAVGMHTNFGVIATVDPGTGICTRTGATAHNARLYAHQVEVTATEAANFGWPATGGSQVFGHGAADIYHPFPSQPSA
jgi:hypothetical protein